MSDQPMTTNQGIEQYFFRASAEDFKKISGSPVAYWVSDKVRQTFEKCKTLESVIKMRKGLATSDNSRFLREWFEVSFVNIGIGYTSRKSALESRKRWFPIHKGGQFRKWYGNHENVINWENDGFEIRNFFDENGKLRSRPQNIEYSFKQALTWSKITSGQFSARYCRAGFLFDDAGAIGHSENEYLLKEILPVLSSKIGNQFLEILNCTLNFQIGDVGRLPILDKAVDTNLLNIQVNCCIELAKTDWDNYETSWDFTENTLIRQKQPTLKAAFEQWQTQNRAAIIEMKRLEEENNRLFIEAYGLQDELTPEVPEDQITLTRADQEKDIQRLISYAIGCMMGRYSLDESGLIYAHAGNVDFDPSRYPSFPADEDGILPLTDQEWFKDDASNRFREFVVAVWGEDTLQQNLEFVAESLTLSSFKPKKGETSLDTVRRYLSNQFYKDHLQTYKKRPIYWLFSSGKQKAFECLVYLHRYNESTLARMRTEYVTPLLGKYSAYADQLNQQLQDASSSEATRIKKDIQTLEKKQTELGQFDDKLKHYADRRIKIDLDDGVKVNYGKFGDLLAEVKAVTGGAGE